MPVLRAAMGIKGSKPKGHYLDRSIKFNNDAEDTVSRVRTLGSFMVFTTLLVFIIAIIDIFDIRGNFNQRNEIETDIINRCALSKEKSIDCVVTPKE